ncbi:carbon-nitrogen hydrolase [soil metagenome]
MSFRLACVQFAPAKAEPETNLDTIAEIAVQTSDVGADLALFPEASTTGYFLEGGVVEASLTIEALAGGLERRLKGRLTRPLDLALGFYENRDGILYNSAAYLEFSSDSVQVRMVYQKFFLPTYGVFDEERFVSRGRHLGVFDTRFGRMGILVCEDIWHAVMPTLCAVRGAQLILVPAASPARGFSGPGIDNHDRYTRLFRGVADEHGVYVASAQLVGFEGGKGFIGGSTIVDPFGQTVVEAPIGEPHLILGDIDLELVTIARAQAPLLSDLKGNWEEVRRLVAETQF